MNLLATGEAFDPTAVFTAITTAVTSYGALAAGLLAVALVITIGIKWTKKIGNKAT